MTSADAATATSASATAASASMSEPGILMIKDAEIFRAFASNPTNGLVIMDTKMFHKATLSLALQIVAEQPIASTTVFDDDMWMQVHAISTATRHTSALLAHSHVTRAFLTFFFLCTAAAWPSAEGHGGVAAEHARSSGHRGERRQRR